MCKSRIARTLICLSLVFVLVFNIYAMPTKAAVGSVIVPALLFITGALIALGISAGNSNDDFNTISGNALSHLQETGAIVGDTVKAYRVDGKLHFLKSLIEAVRSWTHEAEIISSSFVPPDVVGTQNGNFGTYFSIAQRYAYAYYLEYANGHVVLCYDANPIILESGSLVASDGEFVYWNSSSTGTWKGSSFSTSSFVSVVSFGTSCNHLLMTLLLVTLPQLIPNWMLHIPLGDLRRFLSPARL